MVNTPTGPKNVNHDKPSARDTQPPTTKPQGPFTDPDRKAGSPLDTRNPDGHPQGMSTPAPTEHQHTYQPETEKGAPAVNAPKANTGARVIPDSPANAPNIPSE